MKIGCPILKLSVAPYHHAVLISRKVSPSLHNADRGAEAELDMLGDGFDLPVQYPMRTKATVGVAGFAGGVLRGISYKNYTFREAIASPVYGVLAAGYLTEPLIHYLRIIRFPRLRKLEAILPFMWVSFS